MIGSDHSLQVWYGACDINRCAPSKTLAKVTALRIAKAKQRVHTFLKRRTFWRPSICSAKFIAPKQWFVAADGDRYIHVYTYMTMDKLEMFKAHEKGVNSLVVHPSDPFVLSASEDHEIKLWSAIRMNKSVSIIFP